MMSGLQKLLQFEPKDDKAGVTAATRPGLETSLWLGG